MLWKEQIRKCILFERARNGLIPKTCFLPPLVMCHMWGCGFSGERGVGVRRAGQRGDLNVLGGKHLFMFSSWCIVSKGSMYVPSAGSTSPADWKHIAARSIRWKCQTSSPLMLHRERERESNMWRTSLRETITYAFNELIWFHLKSQLPPDVQK